MKSQIIQIVIRAGKPRSLSRIVKKRLNIPKGQTTQWPK